MIHEVDLKEYKSHVRQVYAGPKGRCSPQQFAFLAHAVGRALVQDTKVRSGWRKEHSRCRQRRWPDLEPFTQVCRSRCGHYLLRSVARDAPRARQRLKSTRPTYLAADLTHLPFADETFDCVTCGYVLEHLPDPRSGLAELSRVMKPGGRMLLLTTEDSFGGAWTSYFLVLPYYNRPELLKTCERRSASTAQ